VIEAILLRSAAITAVTMAVHLEIIGVATPLRHREVDIAAVTADPLVAEVIVAVVVVAIVAAVAEATAAAVAAVVIPPEAAVRTVARI
jgi:hypothetical protein